MANRLESSYAQAAAIKAAAKLAAVTLATLEATTGRPPPPELKARLGAYCLEVAELLIDAGAQEARNRHA